MSTRCQILIKDGEGDELLFYRHSDGYPEGTMPTLQEFMKWVRQGFIRDNVEQSTGWLILIGTREINSESSKPVPSLKPNPEDKMYGWKCGIYEPSLERHGDISYLYILDLEYKTITCYKAGVSLLLPDPKEDTLLFIDTTNNAWDGKEE